VDDLFLDENDSPEYLGVKLGLLGTRSTLIPFQMAAVDEANSSITVSTDKETVQNGPTFDDDQDITPEFENEVHGFYGLHQGLQETTGSSEDRGAYADYSSSGSDLADEDELRVQRSDEELRAGTREREAGSVKVRKRVRTDRERIEVPVKHEEVPSSGCRSAVRRPRPRSARTRSRSP
jgi:stress response protein YsnF